MIVIPAIDIQGGRCVRLRQGDPSRSTEFSEYPEEVAQRWAAEGAERIHIVDLDGAFKGSPENVETIQRILESVEVPIQLGGGIRDLETIEFYMNLGVDRVILGTAAHQDPMLVQESCRLFPGRIAVGIDSRKGRVAIKGWTQVTRGSPVEAARRYEKIGVCAIIHTDIERDGMEGGANIQATVDLARSLKIPVIASGGVRDIKDIEAILEAERLLRLEGRAGIEGVIVGRALYTGRIDLREAVRLTKEASHISKGQ